LFCQGQEISVPQDKESRVEINSQISCDIYFNDVTYMKANLLGRDYRLCLLQDMIPTNKSAWPHKEFIWRTFCKEDMERQVGHLLSSFRPAQHRATNMNYVWVWVPLML